MEQALTTASAAKGDVSNSSTHSILAGLDATRLRLAAKLSLQLLRIGSKRSLKVYLCLLTLKEKK